jgi:hypothetical protein
MFGDFNGYLVLAEKIMALIGATIYIVFSLVIVKQVTTMSKNVSDMFNGILIVFSYLHLILALVLTVITWILL